MDGKRSDAGVLTVANPTPKKLAPKVARLLFRAPLSPSWVADLLYLLLFAVLQVSVVPSLLPAPVTIDFLTPWLIVMIVRDMSGRALIHGVIAAMIVETHSAAPAGLYLCAYWMLGGSISLIHHVVAWSQRLPWLSLLVLGETFIFVAEYSVQVVAGTHTDLTASYFLVQPIRIAAATIVGVVLLKLSDHRIEADTGDDD